MHDWEYLERKCVWIKISSVVEFGMMLSCFCNWLQIIVVRICWDTLLNFQAEVCVLWTDTARNSTEQYNQVETWSLPNNTKSGMVV